MQFQVIILCLHTWVAIQGTGGRVPINNWSGGVSGIVSPKSVVFVSTLSRLFCVCGSCCWNLQPSPNSLARFKWAAQRGGEGNAERGGGKRKERKGGIGKGGVAVAPRKKFLRAPTFHRRIVVRFSL